MKRIVTIQDISCLGKCSLTVALPVISAMGIECSIIPTAVLSTHTMFKNFTFLDLTDEINPIKEHWLSEKFEFDAIYTGYLGSTRQLEIVSEFIDSFKTKKNTVFIDPVMADNGKLYPGFTTDFVKNMAKLIKKADIIVPNMTETSFLLNTEYKSSGYSAEYVKDLLKKLCDLGAKKAAITGVSFNKGELGVMCYDSEKDSYYTYMHKKIDTSFHGTGDIFSSCAIGAIVDGYTEEEALSLAADFTLKCIETTVNSKDHVSYGVEFEDCIPYLIKRLSAE